MSRPVEPWLIWAARVESTVREQAGPDAMSLLGDDIRKRMNIWYWAEEPFADVVERMVAMAGFARRAPRMVWDVKPGSIGVYDRRGAK